MKSYTIPEIEAELIQIDKQLERYESLVQRRQDLATLRLLLMKLERSENGSKAQPVPHQPKGASLAEVASEPMTHAEYIELALAQNGPLAIGDLLTAVRKDGWQGSGDDAVDKKRLYVALYREKEKFNHDPDGRWSLG